MNGARVWSAMDRSQVAQLQSGRLNRCVERAYQHSPLCRRLMDSAGVAPQHVRSRVDVVRLPFTSRQDLGAAGMSGALAVARESVARVHGSSGTTGPARLSAYTRADLRIWAELVARVLTLAGVRPGETVQVAFAYGLFSGGFGLHAGAERLGASVVPAGQMNPYQQLKLARELGSTVLTATPTFGLAMVEAARRSAEPPQRIPFRVGCFGAEPWSEETRRKLEEGLGLRAYDNWGLSEALGPGMAGECQERQGMHVWEDHFLVEVVDPRSGRPLGPGEQGEVVVTTLTRVAMPLLRYRTGDISFWIDEPCACGLQFRRLGRIIGRVDDMLVVRGVKLYPSQLEEVLFAVPGAGCVYQVRVLGAEEAAALEIVVETDSGQAAPAVERAAAAAVRNRFGLLSRVRTVPAGTLPRRSGKSRPVVKASVDENHPASSARTGQGGEPDDTDAGAGPGRYPVDMGR